MSECTLYQLDSLVPAPCYNDHALNQMMSYVLVTKNGRIIVIDGGYFEDADRLMDVLKKVGGNRPTVDAWLFTHMHEDHVLAFAGIMDKYCNDITVKRIYFNFPTKEEIAPYNQGNTATYDLFFQYCNKFNDVTKIVEVGDEITVDNIRIETLFVPLNRYAASNNLNNTSVVFKAYIGNQTVMFLGDLAAAASDDFVNEVPSDKLISDVVQMAHHGQYGVNKNVYEAIKPKCCLWCAPDWLWDNDIGKGFNTHGFQTVTVRKWMKELGVKHHIVEKNGIESIEFPLDFDDMTWGRESDPE